MRTAPRPALDRITLTIRPGEVVGLVGPSGAGKSSLADVILGLHKLSAGSRRSAEFDMTTTKPCRVVYSVTFRRILS